MSIRKKTEPVNVTLRDWLIICKALGYAIAAIERLPTEWQEWSDKEDMRELLAFLAHSKAELWLTSARGHLERRGIAFEGGKMVLAPRPPAPVVPIA